MDTKLDRRADQYRSRVYQGRSRECGYRQNIYGSRNRAYSQDWYQNNYRGRRNYNNRGNNIYYRSITEITVGQEIGTVTEMAIDITINQITEQMMAIKDTVIEAKITVDLGTETDEIGVAQRKFSI